MTKERNMPEGNIWDIATWIKDLDKYDILGSDNNDNPCDPRDNQFNSNYYCGFHNGLFSDTLFNNDLFNNGLFGDIFHKEDSK